MDFILIVLAALALHRIWNYEQIFQPLRGWLTHFTPEWFGYLTTCPACNALWIGLFAGAVLPLDPTKISLVALATYPFLRAAVWCYQHTQKQIQDLHDVVFKQTQAETPKAEKQEKEKPAEGCTDCEQKKKGLIAEQKRMSSFKRRVVIMTTLADFNSSYSLSSCVLDQARALSLNADWLIQVWVMQIANEGLWPKDMPKNVELKKVIPMIKWKSDVYEPKSAGLLAATVSRELVALGNADIITHDIMFQSSYLTFAAAIHSIAKLKNFRWWHQAHSGPCSWGERVTELPVLFRYSLPEGHGLININDAHVSGFMYHYGLQGTEHIKTCPNVRDPRILYGASPEIGVFMKNLLSADIVQIYPVSTERTFDKGVQHVIKIFGSLKHLGSSVRLVIANAHANNNESFIEDLKKIAHEWNLTDREVIFTSDHFINRKSAGLTAADTQALFQISNLFVFPTTAEASSLVLTEAALAGALIVLNKDVGSINQDLLGYELTYPFGTSNSPEWPAGCPSPDAIAARIIEILDGSPANEAKRRVLKERNLETIGRQLTKIIEQQH